MIRDLFLSVIMPGYNEGEKIAENLRIVSDIMKNVVTRYEIIFVDDGSQDDTVKNVQTVQKEDPYIKLVVSEQNQGKGNALKLGTAQSAGDYILFLDSDLDLSPNYIADYLDIMQSQNADAVIGSKLHKDSHINYPLVRRIISFGYYLFLLLLFRLNVRDTHTGIKLFRADAIKPVMEIILVKRFAFDIEVLSILNRKKMKILSAPVILNFGRQAQFGRMGIKDIWSVFLDTLAVFYRLNILKYYDKKMEENLEEAK